MPCLSHRVIAALFLAEAVFVQLGVCGKPFSRCTEISGDHSEFACSEPNTSEEDVNLLQLPRKGQVSQHHTRDFNSSEQKLRGKSSSLWRQRPYDIIVVGAGLMGSAVAARLSRNLPHKRVLLIEGGRDMSALHPGSFNFESGEYDEWPGVWYNWSRSDVPGNYQVLNCWSHLAGTCSEFTWPNEYVANQYQVRVQGGGGSINGALHQMPLASMFDGGDWPAWPAGWSSQTLEPFFEEVRHDLHVTATPSADGKHYLDAAGGQQLAEVLAASCPGCRGPGLKHVNDTALPVRGTMGIPQVSARKGLRLSTSSVYLPGALRNRNFRLWLETEVTEVLHSNGRASGVRVLRKGVEKTVRLAPQGLLVMSAGAFNTPRLLLKSGIENQGMGKGLSDRALRRQVYEMSPDWKLAEFKLRPPSNASIAAEVAFRKGPLTQFGPVLVAFVRNPSTPGDAKAWDVEIWVSPSDTGRSISVWYALMRPQCSSTDLAFDSQGSFQMTSPSSLYLGCEADVQTMQYAFDFVQERMAQQTKTATCVTDCVSPKDAQSFAMNHWVGSCSLGRCVDPETLRVHGTSNIAVVDGSMIPRQVWVHPAWTMEAMSLRAGDMLASTL